MAVLTLCGGGTAATARRKPATHTVVIEATRFDPATLTVAVGDTIVWVNKDPFPHTATSPAGGFDSKEIDAGKSWKYRVARRGSFPYVCTYHSTMRGELTVK